MRNILSQIKKWVSRDNCLESEEKPSKFDKDFFAVQAALIGREVYKTDLVAAYYEEKNPESMASKERFFKFHGELHQCPEVKYYALIELFGENDEKNGYLIIEPKDKKIFEKVAHRTNTTFEEVRKIEFLTNFVSAKGRIIREPCGSNGKEILKKENLF